MLGVDNQAAIRAFQSNLRSPGHHLIREIIKMANCLQKRCKKKRYSLTICWTTGHEGIAGNEAAHKEAKKATEAQISEKQLILSYLRKPLLINPAAVKREHHKKLKKSWMDSWRTLPRGQRATCLDASTPSKKFLQAISKKDLSYKAVSCIAQFRLAHMPVNQYLKWIGKVDSVGCSACGTEEETMEHFLLSCPSYTHERWALEQQAKKVQKQLSLGTLLGEPDMITPLANYIHAT